MTTMMVLLSEQRVNTLEIVKFATWASMSVLRISKISFVRELFGRGVSILGGGVSSSSSTFRTFALLWVRGVLRQKQHISYLVGHVESMAMTMLHTPCIEYRVGVSDYTLSPCNIHNNKYNKCLMLLLFVSIIVCRFEWMLDDGWKNGETDRQTDKWMNIPDGHSNM